MRLEGLMIRAAVRKGPRPRLGGSHHQPRTVHGAQGATTTTTAPHKSRGAGLTKSRGRGAAEAAQYFVTLPQGHVEGRQPSADG